MGTLFSCPVPPFNHLGPDCFFRVPKKVREKRKRWRQPATTVLSPCWFPVEMCEESELSEISPGQRLREKPQTAEKQPPGLKRAFLLPIAFVGLKTRFPGLKVRGWHRTVAVAFVEMCELSELSELRPGSGLDLDRLGKRDKRG